MKTITVLAVTLAFSLTAMAQRTAQTRESAEAIVGSLKFQQGKISLQNGLATLDVPDGFRFLASADAATVIFQLWGNPPGEQPLGLLMPDVSPLGRDAWAVIVTYTADGYVKDQDAEKIDYNKMLQEMKTSVENENAERTKNGYPAINLVGWAAPPRYDRATHKLYWAKEIKFAGENEDTLNYNIRMLGRRGVLVLNAVASISQLPEIERAAPKILSSIDFNPGNRYADFSAASGDKVAAYGIAALVAGGIAAKAGLLKGLWLLLLGAKKLIIIAAAAIAAWFRKFFGKKKPVSAVEDVKPTSA